ncbi:MAG: potassium transporter TrkA [Lentisphaerae bacterium GWF2_45_14]|nr:MAG: potassium transporter TrkA [Lentisphaerae bacterium GWF2_45_14]
MAQQALVIGMGKFGMSVAKSLSEKGIDVLAIDRSKELVDIVSGLGIEAIQLDATDENALAQAMPSNRDLAICAIGEESKESSIICTALLRQYGVSRVVARSCNTIHARILKLVGAHLVVNPEMEFGQRLSSRLIYAKVISDMPLGSDLHITEIQIPEHFAGSTLLELSLPKRYEISVIAIRSTKTDAISLPNPQAVLHTEDNLIVISKPDAIAKLMENRQS